MKPFDSRPLMNLEVTPQLLCTRVQVFRPRLENGVVGVLRKKPQGRDRVGKPILDQALITSRGRKIARCGEGFRQGTGRVFDRSLSAVASGLKKVFDRCLLQYIP